MENMLLPLIISIALFWVVVKLVLMEKKETPKTITTYPRASKMRKVTRPGFKASEVTLVEEVHNQKEEKNKDIVPFSIDSPTPARNKASYTRPYSEIPDFTYKFCLQSQNGRFTKDGKVVFFPSKSAAKRMRKVVNRHIKAEFYWVETLKDDEILRNFAVM